MSEFTTHCPHCGGTLEVQDEWSNMEVCCPLCQAKFIVPQRNAGGGARVTPPPAAIPRGGSAGGTLRIVPGDKNGKFTVYGDYGAVWALVRQVMVDCGARIKDENMERGKIVGNCRYGINAFGMTVTATLYSNGNSIGLEFSASFTDALDTFGSCSKKVRQLGDRLMERSSPGGTAGAASASAGGPAAPPAYSQRSGASFAGQARTSLILGLAGLLLGVIPGIIAIVFASIAFNGMSETGNDEGRGMAVAGMILGLVDVIGGILLAVIMFAD